MSSRRPSPALSPLPADGARNTRQSPTVLSSPYPYFGGKSKIAPDIWQRFGDCANYVEPFFGSGAMLLARPHAPNLELINDIDGYVVNFWRAVQADAEAVADYADYPAFENDLHARRMWLVQRKDNLREQLEGNPDYHDAKIAGWWVWGMSLWIGSGFCSGRGPWQSVDGRLVKVEDAERAATVRQLPRVRSVGIGSDRAVARQLPYLSRPLGGVFRESLSSAGVGGQPPRLTGEQGIHRKRLYLMSEKGVNRKLPELDDRGERRDHRSGLYAYFADLQARLARVRVVCGDWTRVISPAVLTAKTPTAILLDPPYTPDGRQGNLYNADEQGIHADVRTWAIENGDNPDYRIAYCGYDDGHEWPASWSKMVWKANGGYANQGDERRENASRETVWFSPHCLSVLTQRGLFDMTAVR